MSEPIKCPECKGTGECPECDGAGFTAGHYFSSDGTAICETCHGKQTCQCCDGTGTACD